MALSRKREEKGAAADPGLVRGEHVPKVPTPPPPMDLRLKDREREGFSSWVNTIGWACPKVPSRLDTLKSERRGDMESRTSPPTLVQLLCWPFHELTVSVSNP